VGMAHGEEGGLLHPGGGDSSCPPSVVFSRHFLWGGEGGVGAGRAHVSIREKKRFGELCLHKGMAGIIIGIFPQEDVKPRVRMFRTGCSFILHVKATRKKRGRDPLSLGFWARGGKKLRLDCVCVGGGEGFRQG